jgi:eukaryotic-like serine/threonine-protein kinase
MRFTAGEWQTLSKLFDEAMELPEEARANWLESLDTAYASLQPALRHMLVRQAKVETDDFLDTLPKFDDVLLGNPTPSPMQGLTAGVAVGPYRLRRELGRGGMGAVWLAERIDGLIKRPVALKLPHPAHYNSQLGERFSREREILAALAHPNIGKLFDAGVTAAGQSYLALEYVEGATITEYCDRKSLSVRNRLELFLQVLEAVQYAHSRLVIHRDLKPSNILVTDERKAVLLDFGIAKLIIDGEAKETELTQLGGRALTPDYASPEQIAGQAITTASDVYSLGIVLYELLTGERPYKLTRDARGALEEAILNAEPPKPSLAAKDAVKAAARSTTAKKLAKTLQGDLDTIVLKSLKKAPNERYATADAFAQDIERYLAGQAVLAQPESLWYRSRKFLSRNKLAAASTAAVFVALAAGLGAALWQAQLAGREARTAAAVQTFLEDIFRANSSLQPDPVKARETPARVLLDAGAAKISASLNDAAEAKVSVLATLADLYDDLGLTEQAVALQKQRVAVAKSTYGAWHAEVADALINLAGALHESSAVNERDAVLREAGAILDRRDDQRSRLRGELDLRLAEFYQSTDLAKTIDFAQRGVKIFRAYPASFSLVQLLTMEGIAYNARKEYREATASLVEAGNVAKALPAGARRTEPIIYAYLAEAQFNLDDFATAEVSYRQAWRAARSLRGEEHEDTIQTQLRLGTFLANTGRAEEGLVLLREAKDLVIRTKGAEDIFHLPRVLSNYGSARIQYGQIEAGVAELSTAIELRRRQRSGTRLLAQMQESEAPGLIALGRHSQAAALLDEASAIRSKIGDKPGSAQFVAIALARVELALATSYVDDAAKAIAGLMPEGDGGSVHLSHTLLPIAIARAKTALAAGRAEEAIDRAGAVRRALEASPSREYFKNYEAQSTLVEGKGRLLLRHLADALPLLKRAVDLDMELYDRERSPVLADAQLALADCYFDLGKRDEAKPLLAQAKAIHAAHSELGEQFKAPLRRVSARAQR